MRAAFAAGGVVEECIRLLERENFLRRLAVFGNSVVGKSSFMSSIDAIILRLIAGSEGAAEVGVKETTTVPRSYAYPDKRNKKYQGATLRSLPE